MVSHSASTFLRLDLISHTPLYTRQPGFTTKTAETVITLFILVAVPREHAHVETGTAYYIKKIPKKYGDEDPRPGPGSRCRNSMSRLWSPPSAGNI